MASNKLRKDDKKAELLKYRDLVFATIDYGNHDKPKVVNYIYDAHFKSTYKGHFVRGYRRYPFMLEMENGRHESCCCVAAMSTLGDLFFIGKDDAVYWLQTDGGELTKVADNLQEFEQFHRDEEKVDNWFLPLLVAKLITAGKTLKENEVYSFKKLPVLGGGYSVDNIEPTDMSVYFAFSGQISEQIKDLPDGTGVNIKIQG